MSRHRRSCRAQVLVAAEFQPAHEPVQPEVETAREQWVPDSLARRLKAVRGVALIAGAQVPVCRSERSGAEPPAFSWLRAAAGVILRASGLARVRGATGLRSAPEVVEPVRDEVANCGAESAVLRRE